MTFTNTVFHLNIKLLGKAQEYQVYIPEQKLTSSYQALVGKQKGDSIIVGKKELVVLDIL